MSGESFINITGNPKTRRIIADRITRLISGWKFSGMKPIRKKTAIPIKSNQRVFQVNGCILNFHRINNNFARLKRAMEVNVANAAPVIPNFGINTRLKPIFNTPRSRMK